MATTTFRRDLRITVPAAYRTPSPPDISPTAVARVPASAQRRKRVAVDDDHVKPRSVRVKHDSQSSNQGLETFASIALATESPPASSRHAPPVQRHPSAHRQPSSIHHSSRQTKRPPDLNLSRNTAHRAAKRPPDTAVTEPESTAEEAELLLGFWRSASSTRATFPAMSPTLTQLPQTSRNIKSTISHVLESPSEAHASLPAASSGLVSTSQLDQSVTALKDRSESSASIDQHVHNHTSPRFTTNTGAAADSKALENISDRRNQAAFAPSTEAYSSRTHSKLQQLSSSSPERSRPTQTVSRPVKLEDTSQSPIANMLPGLREAARAPSSASTGQTTRSEDVLVKPAMPRPDQNQDQAPAEQTTANTSRPLPALPANKSSEGSSGARTSVNDSPSVCAACKFSRDSMNVDAPEGMISWINCDSCKSWFHFACAGFRSDREVRCVDKFRCKTCEKLHGQKTTFVRKSNRVHQSIDYAGLNEGIIKTSDADPEHHYIKHFRNGTISFQQEHFVRMRPELVTAAYFERSDGMKEPVVIPAPLNPVPPPASRYNAESQPRIIADAGRPAPAAEPSASSPSHMSPSSQDQTPTASELRQCQPLAASSEDVAAPEKLAPAVKPESADAVKHEAEQPFGSTEVVLPNDADTSGVVQSQLPDGLDMVMPHDLTVRKVAELYGFDEKIEVIDVKSQNGEDKRWTMRKWVEYYESTKSKAVRNVISLEFSHSLLANHVQRPQIVRDLDLQDHVWPPGFPARKDFPKVQLYCLMSVADCYTDFHIDFGGSSVFYHILRGKKTFFFIPPSEKHLKKYEEWCNSPAQNWTFLGEQTKECYRVDLEAGDTMLIPAGWIHAVWTPENSLVIGGNFLTRMHFQLQFRVSAIEKATHVARKFRYPQFQKIMWYAALQYLSTDPIPDSVMELLQSGRSFERSTSVEMYEKCGDASLPGAEHFHARFYSRAELDGLPDLARYLWRTAMIAMGCLTDGVTIDTKAAVKRSIPKLPDATEPVDIVKRFGAWCAWKRGNETLPSWAYESYVPAPGAPELSEKKPNTKMLRRLDREAASAAFKEHPQRQSARVRQQNEATSVLGQQPQTATAQNSTHTATDEATSTPQFGTNPALQASTRIPQEANLPDRATAQRSEMLPEPRAEASMTVDTKEATISSSSRQNGDPALPLADSDPPKGNLAAERSPPPSSTTLQQSWEDQADQNQNNGLPLGKQSALQATRDEVPSESSYAVPPTLPGNPDAAEDNKACLDCHQVKCRCKHGETTQANGERVLGLSEPRSPARKRRATSVLSTSNSSAENSSKLGNAVDVLTAEGHNENRLATAVNAGNSAPSASSGAPRSKKRRSVPRSARRASLTKGAEEYRAVTSPSPEEATGPDSKARLSGDQSEARPLSLISPPESTNDDGEESVPEGVVAANPKDLTPPATANSSRHSSRPAKGTPRRTPDSVAVRRGSTHSTTTLDSPLVDGPALASATSSARKRTKSRASSGEQADSDLMRAIRHSYASDRGLRQRS